MSEAAIEVKNKFQASYAEASYAEARYAQAVLNLV